MQADAVMLIAVVSARCFGVFVSLPWGEALQIIPRLFLSIGLGALLSGDLPSGAQLSVVSCLWEFGLGVLLGAPLRFLVDCAEMFGELIDTARGQTISAVVDPLSGQGASDLANVSKAAAALLTVQLGGLEFAVDGIARSFELLPCGTPWLGAVEAESFVRWALAVLAAVFQISSVWFGAYIVTDIVTALAARLVKGIQCTVIGSLMKLVFTCILGGVLLGLARDMSPDALQRLLGEAFPKGAEGPRSGGR